MNCGLRFKKFPSWDHELRMMEIQTTYDSITKKRGVVIRSASELDEISRLLNHPKVGELSKRIDAVNPKREVTTEKGGPDIFEI